MTLHPDLLDALVRMTPAERDKLTTPDERRLVIEIRKRCVLGSKVRERLGCTQAELDRWDRPGRLPHTMLRRLKIQGSTAQNCRA